MACRIRDHVTHGEIDNRERGRVTGKIWLHGMDEPVVLELKGNACADIAGCLLKFRVTQETFPFPKTRTLFSDQTGTAGDMTASRKVRIPSVTGDEVIAARRRGGKPPEHMGNCLYLEWYDPRNGRVVIETTHFESTVTEALWEITPDDENARAEQSARGFSDFLGKLSDAVERAESKTPWGKDDWDEFDHERMMRESDARTDKYAELLDKYGDSPEAEAIIAREMGWDRDHEDIDPAWAAERDEMIREINELSAAGGLEEPEPDPAKEGVDWMRTEAGDIRHPLQHRVFEGALEFWHLADQLEPKGAEHPDPDLWDLVSSYQILGVKLAGALNGLARDRGIEDPGAIVARMKRALTFLHEAQAALVKVGEKGLLPAGEVKRLRDEFFGVREEMLRLMTGFRQAS